MSAFETLKLVRNSSLLALWPDSYSGQRRSRRGRVYSSILSCAVREQVPHVQ
jgi:hypothetical protein